MEIQGAIPMLGLIWFQQPNGTPVNTNNTHKFSSSPAKPPCKSHPISSHPRRAPRKTRISSLPLYKRAPRHLTRKNSPPFHLSLSNLDLSLSSPLVFARASRVVVVGGGAMAGRSELVVSFGEMLIDFVPTVAGVSLAEAPAFVKAPGGAGERGHRGGAARRRGRVRRQAGGRRVRADARGHPPRQRRRRRRGRVRRRGAHRARLRHPPRRRGARVHVLPQPQRRHAPHPRRAQRRAHQEGKPPADLLIPPPCSSHLRDLRRRQFRSIRSRRARVEPNLSPVSWFRSLDLDAFPACIDVVRFRLLFVCLWRLKVSFSLRVIRVLCCWIFRGNPKILGQKRRISCWFWSDLVVRSSWLLVLFLDLVMCLLWFIQTSTIFGETNR